MTYAASLASVQGARERIAGVAHVTPVHTSRTLNQLSGLELFFKCENFQRIGAFKFRGAMNAISRLDDATASGGVATHSSGNHAQAVALAAKLRGIPAHIVMPNNAPDVKRVAVEGYGGRVVPCAPTLQAREDTAAAVVTETGATLIPPFDHPDVMSGQGTVALELLEQVSDLDALVVPLSGGGLISGIAVAATELSPTIRIFGVEPTGADDAFRSKAAGHRLGNDAPHTIADGLLASIGELTWPVVRDRVEAVFTVSDDEILASMHLLMERMKLVTEPSGAVGLAAVLQPTFRTHNFRRVGIVLSGGNLDLSALFAGVKAQLR